MPRRASAKAAAQTGNFRESSSAADATASTKFYYLLIFFAVQRFPLGKRFLLNSLKCMKVEVV